MTGRPRTHPRSAAILVAYIAGEPVESICAVFGCGKNVPAAVAKRAGVELRKPVPLTAHPVRPRVAPQVAPSSRISNRIASSEARRAPAKITLATLNWGRP
jgi:hypothetical protein